MTDEVEVLNQVITAALDAVHECLQPECRVLLAWRLPGDPEAEAIVTNDEDLDEMIQVLERSKQRC